MVIGGLAGTRSSAASISKTESFRSGSGSSDVDVDVDVALPLLAWTRRPRADVMVEGEDPKALVGDGVGKAAALALAFARPLDEDEALSVSFTWRLERRVPTSAGAGTGAGAGARGAITAFPLSFFCLLRLGCSSSLRSVSGESERAGAASAFLFLGSWGGGVATRMVSSAEGERERFLRLTFTLWFLVVGRLGVCSAGLFLGGRPRLFGGGGGATGSGSCSGSCSGSGSGLGLTSGAPEMSSQNVGDEGGEGEWVKSVRGLDGGVLIEVAMVFIPINSDLIVWCLVFVFVFVKWNRVGVAV